MAGCVQTHALLSALALRIEREGYVPSEPDLRALLALGISQAEIAAAIARVNGDAAQAAAEVLRTISS